MLYRVYNRKYDYYHHPGDPKGVMAHRDRAWVWDTGRPHARRLHRGRV
jgi:hypothetical protein